MRNWANTGCSKQLHRIEMAKENYGAGWEEVLYLSRAPLAGHGVRSSGRELLGVWQQLERARGRIFSKGVADRSRAISEGGMASGSGGRLGAGCEKLFTASSQHHRDKGMAVV